MDLGDRIGIEKEGKGHTNAFDTVDGIHQPSLPFERAITPHTLYAYVRNIYFLVQYIAPLQTDTEARISRPSDPYKRNKRPLRSN